MFSPIFIFILRYYFWRAWVTQQKFWVNSIKQKETSGQRNCQKEALRDQTFDYLLITFITGAKFWVDQNYL